MAFYNNFNYYKIMYILKNYKEKEKINIGKIYTILLYYIHVFLFIYISEQTCFKTVVI